MLACCQQTPTRDKEWPQIRKNLFQNQLNQVVNKKNIFINIANIQVYSMVIIVQGKDVVREQ